MVKVLDIQYVLRKKHVAPPGNFWLEPLFAGMATHKVTKLRLNVHHLSEQILNSSILVYIILEFLQWAIPIISICCIILFLECDLIFSLWPTMFVLPSWIQLCLSSRVQRSIVQAWVPGWVSRVSLSVWTQTDPCIRVKLCKCSWGQCEMNQRTRRL